MPIRTPLIITAANPLYFRHVHFIQMGRIQMWLYSIPF